MTTEKVMGSEEGGFFNDWPVFDLAGTCTSF